MWHTIEDRIPDIGDICKQTYTVHMDDNEYPFYISPLKEDIVEIIYNSNLSISQIKTESNKYGLLDYRIFCSLVH